MASRSAVDRLRQPEYIGENRCLPCTAVNAVIAAVLAVAVVALAGARVGWIVGVLAGAVVVAVSGASIYLRGYLIPGTPWFTRTYFPDWLLRRFDKDAQPEFSVDDEFDVETVLTSAAAVEPCEHEDDLCLTADFRAAWNDRIGAVRTDETSRTALAEILDVDPDRLAFEEFGDAFVARVEDTRAGRWESRAAFLADVAAAIELRQRLDGWSALDVTQRSRVLYSLRLFLEQCPACSGPVAISEDTVESCCRSRDIVAVSCRECDARMFEADHPGERAHAA